MSDEILKIGFQTHKRLNISTLNFGRRNHEFGMEEFGGGEALRKKI
jgi:hypothetical protein